MKSLLIFSIFVFAAVAQKLDQPLPSNVVEPYRKSIDPNLEVCFAESGAKPDFLERFLLYRDYADDKPSKCFMKCHLRRLGFMNEKGEALAEKIVKAFGGDTATVERCTKLTETDVCDRAMFIASCFYTSYIEAIINPKPA